MLLRYWDYFNALYAFANKIFKFERCVPIFLNGK